MSEDPFDWPITGVYDLAEKYTHTNGKTYNLKRVEVYRQDYAVEDHGILTLYIGLEGGLNTSFGGYAHDTPAFDEDGKRLGRIETAFGRDVIKEVLRVFDVPELHYLLNRRIYAIENPDRFTAPACLGFVSQDHSRVFLMEDLLMKHYPDETTMQKKVERLNGAFNGNLDYLFNLFLTTEQCFSGFLFGSLTEYDPDTFPGGSKRDQTKWTEAIELLINAVKNNGAKRGSFRYTTEDIIKKLGL